MYILSGDDVSSILRNLSQDELSDTLYALASGLAAYTAQKSRPPENVLIQQPHRTSITTINQDTALIMPVNDSSSTSVKVVTVPHTGPIQGAITIYARNGELQGVLNAAEITAFRTALTSMSLVVRCKQIIFKQVVIFGAGKQVEWHIRLLLRLVPDISRITVVNRSKQRLEDLKQDLSSDMGDVELILLSHEDHSNWQLDLKERLRLADLICGCTPSTKPLFDGQDLQSTTPKSRVICLIGSYKPTMREVDTATIQSASKIWVDCKEACLEEAGELIHAGIKPRQLSELGELLSSPDEQAIDDVGPSLIIFKCVGLGIMDLVVSKTLLQIAEAKSLGTVVGNF